MMKKKRKVLLAICLLIGLYLVFYILTLGIERIKNEPAELYVNGKRIAEPVNLYWYGKSVLVQFPLYSTLEALGCQIDENGSDQDSDAVIRAGSREFIVERYGEFSDLFENGYKIYDDVARAHNGSKGPLYLDDRNYQRVLTILGFDHISCEINEDAYVVWLTAEPKWQ